MSLLWCLAFHLTVLCAKHYNKDRSILIKCGCGNGSERKWSTWINWQVRKGSPLLIRLLFTATETQNLLFDAPPQILAAIWRRVRAHTLATVRAKGRNGKKKQRRHDTHTVAPVKCERYETWAQINGNFSPNSAVSAFERLYFIQRAPLRLSKSLASLPTYRTAVKGES